MKTHAPDNSLPHSEANRSPQVNTWHFDPFHHIISLGDPMMTSHHFLPVQAQTEGTQGSKLLPRGRNPSGSALRWLLDISHVSDHHTPKTGHTLVHHLKRLPPTLSLNRSIVSTTNRGVTTQVKATNTRYQHVSNGMAFRCRGTGNQRRGFRI